MADAASVPDPPDPVSAEVPMVDTAASVPDPPVPVPVPVPVPDLAEADPVPVLMANAAVSISDNPVPVSVPVDFPLPVNVSEAVTAPADVIGDSVAPTSPSAASASSGSMLRLQLGPYAVELFREYLIVPRDSKSEN